jgi:S-disulfanyl-L-cysteine oxidoreductase SoxD
MHLPGWTILLASCMLASIPSDGRAQGTSRNGARSTRSGVYSAEQAARGRDVYAGLCTGCHNAGSHVGELFRKQWDGRQVSDLFGYMREQMPKNDPGSLTRRQYSQVIAYLLSLNGMPVGREELPADSLALSRIRIEMAPALPARNP